MKKILVLCSYPLPTGMAATTRIMTYSKGLHKNGIDVCVQSYIPSGTLFSDSLASTGEVDGVKYEYPFRKKRFANKILHIFESIYSIILTFFKIIFKRREARYDAIIISNDSPLILFLFSLASTLTRAKCIFIFDEYPTPIRKYLKKSIPFYKRIFYKIALRNVDAYISMTENLISYYNAISSKKSLVLSTIIDIDRFKGFAEKSSKSDSSKIHLTYMGNMELTKDNVDNLIKSLPKIHQTLPHVHLNLYGTPNSKDKRFLIELIQKYDLNGYVHFHYAKFHEVPSILYHSDLLVSSQPLTKRAEGGFPTKVGEYLASGSPTLITNVGETSKYLLDKEHIYFAKAEDPEEFANKVIEIIQNYPSSLQVAKAGKHFVEQNYSHESAGEKLKLFIEQLDKK